MKTTVIGICALLLLLPSTRAAEPGTSTPTASLRQVKVDPRIELFSIIFRLAGNPEYNQGKVEAYTLDVDQHFGSFHNHAVVRLARELRRTRGVSYDAVMSLAVHVQDAEGLSLVVPLNPWPEGLDQRWTPESVDRFLAAARQFVQETGFQKFRENHQKLYDLTAGRMQALLEKNAHLEWYESYFGARPGARFTAVPALLNGGSCYGARCRMATGEEELYCLLGVWKTDPAGRPEFTADMLGTVVHEFCHSFANPIIARHEPELSPAGEKIFRHVARQMRAQAYGNAGTMLRESLVRACTVRFQAQFDGPAAARRAAQSEAARGFAWTGELSALLGEYEVQRQQYPTLDSFAPRLVEFFTRYAEQFDQQQTALAAKRPKIVSLIPVNGAEDVAPDLSEIKVVFDRPMEDGSWSMCGGGPHYPETPGKPKYDVALTTWTAPVRLKPNWSYEFWLNTDRFDSFRSAEGVPLESVHVTFKTTAK